MTTVIRGDAGFKYTPDTVEYTLPLDAPLRFGVPRQLKRRYVRESLDLSVVDTTTVGSGVWEVDASILYQTAPQAVLGMLEHAADGGTVKYYPSLSIAGESYTLRIMGASDEVAIEPDAVYGGYQYRYQRTLRLRASSGNLEALISGTLFRYFPGMDYSAATQSRASVATYRTQAGLLASAASGVLRHDHWVLNPVSGLHERSTLLEPARENGWTWSEQLDNPVWVKAGASVPTPNTQTAPDGTVTADLLVEDTSLGAHFWQRDIVGATDDTDQSFSFYVPIAGRAWIYVEGLTKAGSTVAGSVNVTDGTLANVSGTLTLRTVEVTPGKYRIEGTFNAGNGGSTPRLAVYMATGAGAAATTYTGDGSTGIAFWGMQIEVDRSAPSSYMKNEGTLVPRAADSLSFPYTLPPQELTGAVHFIEGGTVKASGAGVMHIGNAANTGAKLQIRTLGGSLVYQLLYSDGTTTRSSALATAPSVGQDVWLRWTLSSAGVIQLHQSIDDDAETSGLADAALALPAAWADTLIWLNSLGSAAQGMNAFLEGPKIARGIQTLARMKEL